jgi:hypothetical protein
MNETDSNQKLEPGYDYELAEALREYAGSFLDGPQDPRWSPGVTKFWKAFARYRKPVKHYCMPTWDEFVNRKGGGGPFLIGINVNGFRISKDEYLAFREATATEDKP